MEIKKEELKAIADSETLPMLSVVASHLVIPHHIISMGYRKRLHSKNSSRFPNGSFT